MPAIAPNTALYVKNIDTKIKKLELRQQLYVLFNAYGKVIDVVATRADGMRGQAFIVFRDLQSSTAAMRALDGFSFYDRPLSISYAKTKSKATIVDERGPEALFDPAVLASFKSASSSAQRDAQGSNAATAVSSSKVTLSNAQAELRLREKKRQREEAGGGAGGAESDEGEDMEEEDDDDEGGKEEGGAETARGAAVAAGGGGGGVAKEEEEDRPKEKVARLNGDQDKSGRPRGAEASQTAGPQDDDDEEEAMELSEGSDEEARPGKAETSAAVKAESGPTATGSNGAIKDEGVAKSKETKQGEEKQGQTEEAQGEKRAEEEDEEDEAEEEEPDFGPPQAVAGKQPNPMLFLPSLPPEVSEDMLGALFQQHAGFKQVHFHAAEAKASPPKTRRSTRSSRGGAAAAEAQTAAHAFVEFDTTRRAGAAKEALDGHEVAPGSGKKLDVVWAKRA